MKRVIMAAMMIVLMIASMAVPTYAAPKSEIDSFSHKMVLKLVNANNETVYYYFCSNESFDVQYKVTDYRGVPPWNAIFHEMYFSSTVAQYWKFQSGTDIYPFNSQTNFNKTTSSTISASNPVEYKVITSNVPIYEYGTGNISDIYSPDINYEVNPGDYVRFTKEGSESWGILINVVSGNEPYMQVRNYFSTGSVNTYFASPLSSMSVLTNDHIDIDLKSTRNNEPLVITTSAEMEKLSTGGTPPPDGTTNQELTLSTNPDTAIFTNLTGETQYISYWREEIGENQFTQIKVESKVGNYWQVMGSTPQIKDVKVRKIPIAANVRYTIFNNNGSTKITYPVTEGFNVQTLTNGVYNPPEWNGNEYGGGIALPDDPSIITDPGSIYPNVPIPERPDDVLGLLNWAADLTLEFITAMGAAVGGMFQFLQKFGTLFGAITFLPAEFTIAFTMLIIVSLALRVVGR